jgi:hypothetical protein
MNNSDHLYVVSKARAVEAITRALGFRPDETFIEKLEEQYGRSWADGPTELIVEAAERLPSRWRTGTPCSTVTTLDENGLGSPGDGPRPRTSGSTSPEEGVDQ